MKIELREDLAPNPEFYYRQQFEIYDQSFLIWDRETWEAVLAACRVYQIEVDGKNAGDVIWEEKGRESKYLVDFGLLPEYRGKGVGKEVLEALKGMGGRLTAVTRKETLEFFLKSGFVIEKRMRNYYGPGLMGYYIRYQKTGMPPVRRRRP